MELPITVDLVPQHVQGESDTVTVKHPWDHWKSLHLFNHA